ncbi:MAG: DedA family protein [Phycisphaerae bacterium]|nr:DedA family protein [Phycisphaerae bacterium]
MHFPSPNNVEDWMTTGGYVLLFALLFACGLGLPLPEDIPLIAAGALIATGKMHLAIAAVVAWCGIIGGDCVLYHLGRRFGLGITKVPFVGKHVTVERIERVERLFDRYGFGVICIGRMVAGVRGAMVVAAGAIRYPFTVFVLADGVGAIISGGFFMFIGHWLGKNLDEEKIRRFKFWFLAAALVGAALFIIWIWRNHKKHQLMEFEKIGPPHGPPPQPPEPPMSGQADSLR